MGLRNELFRWLWRASKDDLVLAESCASVAAMFKIRLAVRICVVDTRTTPRCRLASAAGSFVPRELIDALSPQQVRSILAHELAHLLPARPLGQRLRTACKGTAVVESRGMVGRS